MPLAFAACLGTIDVARLERMLAQDALAALPLIGAMPHSRAVRGLLGRARPSPLADDEAAEWIDALARHQHPDALTLARTLLARRPRSEVVFNVVGALADTGGREAHAIVLEALAAGLDADAAEYALLCLSGDPPDGGCEVFARYARSRNEAVRTVATDCLAIHRDGPCLDALRRGLRADRRTAAFGSALAAAEQFALHELLDDVRRLAAAERGLRTAGIARLVLELATGDGDLERAALRELEAVWPRLDEEGRARIVCALHEAPATARIEAVERIVRRLEDDPPPAKALARLLLHLCDHDLPSRAHDPLRVRDLVARGTRWVERDTSLREEPTVVTLRLRVDRGAIRTLVRPESLELAVTQAFEEGVLYYADGWRDQSGTRLDYGFDGRIPVRVVARG